MIALPDRQGALEAENAALRARIEELERKLYPPPPPPKAPDDPHRYILVPREIRERDDAWARVQHLFASWAIEYAQQRHPEFRWHYAYGWDDIPKHGQYTTCGQAHEAKRSGAPVTLYEIDDRRRALDAITVERERLRERESELHESLAGGRRLAEHRIVLHRLRTLDRAGRDCGRAFEIACYPLTDYGGVTRSAAEIVDHTLAAAQLDVRIEDIPGFLPDGWWECEDCGYPYPDSEVYEGGGAFRCCACHVADPWAGEARQKLIEEMRAQSRDDIAENLERDWQAAVDRAATRLNAR